MELNKLIHGDCLEVMKDIEDGSVDLILTDPPYGTIKGLNASDIKLNNDKGYVGGGGYKTYKGWDDIIPIDKIMQIANRVLRKCGKMVLFAQQPFTTELIYKAIPNLPHNYNMVWEKDNFANCLFAKKAPVSYYEDILVFTKEYKKYDFKGMHPLRLYFKSVLDFIGLNLKQINNTLGHRRAEHTFYVTPKNAIISEIVQTADHTFRVGSSQFALCTEKTYLELIDVFGIDKMENFKDFVELKKIDVNFKDNYMNEFSSTFNLWEGNKYKSNILKYKKDYGGFHPTQKPVLLIEDLIKTYTNENDTVLDFTIGSGTTAIACINTNRNFIGIEKAEKYYNIAKERIDDASKKAKEIKNTENKFNSWFD